MILAARLSLLAKRPPAYQVSDWESAVHDLGRAVGYGLEWVLDEPELVDAETGLRRQLETLPPEAPFGAFHNGDVVLARLCYAVVRQLKPACVVETGVCYGVTSAFILAALERNGKGTLHSIDLPPLGSDGDRFVGWAVTDGSSKSRWQLHRGVSGKILPALLQRTGPVDVFIHDSLHTYRNMRLEFELVWPHMPPGGVLISDDIQGNAAFQDFANRSDAAFRVAMRELEKDSLLGVLVKRI
jgi:predicted O-methyltransferase YrrM